MRANTEAEQASRVTAAMHPAPSRESYFAIYWDHARDLARVALCMMAGFSSAEVAQLVRDSWGELLEYQRARLRAALLQFMAVHDQVRAEINRAREIRGERAPSPSDVEWWG